MSRAGRAGRTRGRTPTATEVGTVPALSAMVASPPDRLRSLCGRCSAKAAKEWVILALGPRDRGLLEPAGAALVSSCCPEPVARGPRSAERDRDLLDGLLPLRVKPFDQLRPSPSHPLPRTRAEVSPLFGFVTTGPPGLCFAGRKFPGPSSAGAPHQLQSGHTGAHGRMAVVGDHIGPGDAADARCRGLVWGCLAVEVFGGGELVGCPETYAWAVGAFAA